MPYHKIDPESDSNVTVWAMWKGLTFLASSRTHAATTVWQQSSEFREAALHLVW